MAVNDIFDPYIQESVANSRWAVDYSMPGTDEAGWTYAFDFATLNKQTVGEPTPGWNSFARRRKWRYNDESGRSATLDA